MIDIRPRDLEILPMTPKCNHDNGSLTKRTSIVKIHPYFKKGLHLGMVYETRCKHCREIFDVGYVPTIKDFLKVYKLKGEIPPF